MVFKLLRVFSDGGPRNSSRLVGGVVASPSPVYGHAFTIFRVGTLTYVSLPRGDQKRRTSETTDDR